MYFKYWVVIGYIVNSRVCNCINCNNIVFCIVIWYVCEFFIWVIKLLVVCGGECLNSVCNFWLYFGVCCMVINLFSL